MVLVSHGTLGTADTLGLEISRARESTTGRGISIGYSNQNSEEWLGFLIHQYFFSSLTHDARDGSGVFAFTSRKFGSGFVD